MFHQICITEKFRDFLRTVNSQSVYMLHYLLVSRLLWKYASIYFGNIDQVKPLSPMLLWSVLGASDEQLLRLHDSNSALKCEDLTMLVNYAAHKLQCHKLKIDTIYNFINVYMLTVYLLFYIV